MSRLAYVADIRLPSQRASAVQVLNQCQALIQAGGEVDLIVPYRLARSPESRKLADLSASTGLRRLPRLVFLPCLDLTFVSDRLPERLALVLFYLQHLSFLTLAAAFLALKRPSRVHTREVHLPLFWGRVLEWLGVRMTLELHNFPTSRAGIWVHRLAVRRAVGVAVISQGLAQAIEEGGLVPRRLSVLPDAVGEAFFQPLGSVGELRHALDLPTKDPIVLYAGTLYWAWKGVRTLIEAQRISGDKAWLVIVGGSPLPRHLEEMKSLVESLGLRRVILTGFVPPAQVPAYLQAADVLVLPNSGAAEISRLYTSPLKLFEYLASGRPIIASDLPSIREILTHGRDGWLVPPDDPSALAAGITTLLDAPDLGAALARQGRAIARRHTWLGRAESLMELAR